MKTRLNLGIVGAGGRGASFKAACDALPDVSVLAVCDNRAEVLDAARERLGAREQYADYETMIERSDLDAVILGTPMHLHVPQAVAALERNLSVLSEECLPDFWKDGMERARAAGHGGGDYFEILDFVDAIQGRRPCPIGIDEAMDMTLPGLVSQQSILEGGRWLDVPDSRAWR